MPCRKIFTNWFISISFSLCYHPLEEKKKKGGRRTWPMLWFSARPLPAPGGGKKGGKKGGRKIRELTDYAASVFDRFYFTPFF